MNIRKSIAAGAVAATLAVGGVATSVSAAPVVEPVAAHVVATQANPIQTITNCGLWGILRGCRANTRTPVYRIYTWLDAQGGDAQHLRR